MENEMSVPDTARVLEEYISRQVALKKPISNGNVISLLLNGLETSIEFFCIEEKDELIYFDNETGRYTNTGKRKVRGFCESVIRRANAVNYVNTNIIEEVINHVKRNSYVSMDDFDNEALTLIPLGNGILDLTSNELIPYSSEYRFLKTLAVKYDPSATCPKIDAFLEQICTDNDGNLDEKAVRGLRQLVAYCLWRGYPMQKMFFLIGSGANGKGVYCEILQKFLGADNCSSVPLVKLTTDRFAGADLEKMSANISNELTVSEIKNFDGVKSLVSGTDRIRIERKHQQAYSVMMHAKLINASNKPPKSSDASDGFYRRLILFFFQRQFLGNDAKLGLERELTTDEELSGFLNKILQELREWIADCYIRPDAAFCNDMSVDMVRELYERASDTVAAFEYECLDFTQNPNDVISKEELYAAYRDYCRNKRLPPVGDLVFKREFSNRNTGKLQTTYTNRKGSRERSYCGIKLVQMVQDKTNLLSPTYTSSTLPRVNREIPAPSAPNQTNLNTLSSFATECDAEQPAPSAPNQTNGETL